jgi:hypothetical protein
MPVDVSVAVDRYPASRHPLVPRADRARVPELALSQLRRAVAERPLTATRPRGAPAIARDQHIRDSSSQNREHEGDGVAPPPPMRSLASFLYQRLKLVVLRWSRRATTLKTRLRTDAR